MEQSKDRIASYEQYGVNSASMLIPTTETPQPACTDATKTALMLLLQHIGTYFHAQAEENDVDMFNFSLSHVFNRIDFLYREALPGLAAHTANPPQTEVVSDDLLWRQHLWLQLQMIHRALDRMIPLCYLLSDVIESLLDTLENVASWLYPFQDDTTLLLTQTRTVFWNHMPQIRPKHLESPPQTLDSQPAEIEQAASLLIDRLLHWQEQHHQLVPFAQQFSSHPVNLSELDSAFCVLLDSVGAIFGDILPNFRLVQPEDREEISALLFDLMQQADQMLIQFTTILEPLNKLIKHFSAQNESKST